MLLMEYQTHYTNKPSFFDGVFKNVLFSLFRKPKMSPIIALFMREKNITFLMTMVKNIHKSLHHAQ